MTEVLDVVINFFYEHRYFFALLGALIEGNNIFIVSGFLAKLQVFDFWRILFVVLIGYFINGYALYAIGFFGGRRVLEKWGPRFFLSKERLEKLENYYKKHTIKALLATRMTYGISTYVFMMAGIFRTKLRKFFWCNLLASTGWVLLLFGIGYSFGASYELFHKVAKVVAVWIGVIMFIAIMGIAIWLVNRLKQKASLRFLQKVFDNDGWEKLKLFGKKISQVLSKNDDN